MSRFIQIHMLTSYPPANLNRDDLNRPKTAMMGGRQRLRISSQCLKRHWRASDAFQEAMAEHLGCRTKLMGEAIHDALVQGIPLRDAMQAGGSTGKTAASRKLVSEKEAGEWAEAIAGQFGKLKAKSREIEQLAHFSPEEIDGIDQLLLLATERGEGPKESELDLLRAGSTAVDIAMFGRMLADRPARNVEAAVQVAHAISVNQVAVEDDYFTAVDDLNKRHEDRGSAHIGELGFGAGVFYEYICINRTLLEENLGGDAPLAKNAIKALIEAAAKVAPSGKTNSFGNPAYAFYLLVEKGEQQPRSLAVAFLDPIEPPDMIKKPIEALRRTRTAMEKAYGKCADAFSEMSVPEDKGSLEDIQMFAVKD